MTPWELSLLRRDRAAKLACAIIVVGLLVVAVGALAGRMMLVEQSTGAAPRDGGSYLVAARYEVHPDSELISARTEGRLDPLASRAPRLAAVVTGLARIPYWTLLVGALLALATPSYLRARRAHRAMGHQQDHQH
jgi:hypothetical protein